MITEETKSMLHKMSFTELKFNRETTVDDISTASPEKQLYLVELYKTIQEEIENRLCLPQSLQETFNPIDYTFEWTEDWYKFDDKQAHKLALQARNKRAKELEKKGYKVYKSSESNQLISRGGIGSGYPHIELIVNVYVINARLQK